MIKYLKSLKDKTKLKTDPENTFTDPGFFYPHEIINECKDNVAEALNFAALAHKSQDFARSTNLNEHLSYNLTDDKGNLIFKVFDDNAKSFPVISPQKLIDDNSDIIDFIQSAFNGK